MVGTIYCLRSSRDLCRRVRYIGKTDGAAFRRFRKHKFDAAKGSVLRVHQWMRREWRNGFEIECFDVEQWPESDLEEREDYWIKALPCLLNIRKTTSMSRGIYAKDKDKITAIENEQISWTNNINGFVGVRYHYKEQVYTVLSHRTGNQLYGEYLPIDYKRFKYNRKSYSYGYFYFYDLVRALAARDRHRDITSKFNRHPALSWAKDRPTY